MLTGVHWTNHCLSAEDMAELLLSYTTFESREHGVLAVLQTVRDADLEFALLDQDALTNEAALQALRTQRAKETVLTAGVKGECEAIEGLLEDPGTPVRGPSVLASWVVDDMSSPVTDRRHVDVIESHPERALLCTERVDVWEGPAPSSADAALDVVLDVYADSRGFTVQHYRLQVVLLA